MILVRAVLISGIGWLTFANSAAVPERGSEAASAPAGNVITVVDATPDSGWASSIVIGRDGLPIVSCLDLDNDVLKLVHCGDQACSSGNTVAFVDGSSYIAESTSVAIGRDGLPVIAYGAMLPALKIVHCGTPGCTSGNVVTPIDPGGAHGLHPKLRIGADGLPVVAYYDAGMNAARVARCGDPGCAHATAATVATFTTEPGPYYFAALAVGEDGLPILGVYDDKYTFMGSLDVIHCRSGDCSSTDAPVVIDATPDVGGEISLAIGTDGLPLLTYGSVGWASLKVAHCDMPDCISGAAPATIHPRGQGGSDTSVAIGRDGLPIISFCVSYAALYVAHCGDVACSAGNTITAIDSGEWVGRSSSIAIGADGLPVISYYGAGGALTVAHCGTPTCSPPGLARLRRHIPALGP